ncbi:MAG: hypothetical protein ACLF0G_16990 [Candidatus Brocadiia bacterium]
MDFEAFRNPDSFLRPAPFWAINDRVTPEETARQMADMVDKGLSGGFFHSRAGLVTDYLGEEWFAAMRAALQVAEEKDGYLWLYDEDLWPSGNAGGQVAALGDEYRQAYLEPEYVRVGEEPLEDGEGQPLAAYAVLERDGASLRRCQRIPPVKAATDTVTERLVVRRCYAPRTGWWSGESYANLLNPQVTRKFIQFTHEVYRQHLGEHFGERVPGIFTDEPQLYSRPCALPWWEGLPEAYAQATERDFWDDLPFLFFDGPECRRVRLLVYRTIHRLFCEHYSRPLYEWCEANGLEHTGHYNAEDSLAGQLLNHCGAVASHYRYQQLPGIDHLCRQTEPMLLTVKQASSAARQLGRRGVLTEIFGVSHHTNTFEDFRWIGDYNLVLGATFFCPHLTWYSMRGKRKRDYPPNWNYQQTYWPHLRPLNDYFTRLAAALTAGKPQCEVLLVHPVEGASASLRRTVDTGTRGLPHGVPGPDLGRVGETDRVFRSLLDAALNAGYDCDLGHEGYLEDLGRVEGKKLAVGQMAYSVVVVPACESWRPATYRLLKDFAAAGGRLILTGRLPAELDCQPAEDAWRELAEMDGVTCVPASPRELQDALDRTVRQGFRLRALSGRPVPHLYVQHRKDRGQDLFFVVNSDREARHALRLTILRAPEGKAFVRWDPLEGTREKLEAKTVGKGLACDFELPPCGSILIAVVKEAAARGPKAKPIDLGRGDVRLLPARWDHARTQPNVLVLDRVAYSLDGGKTFSAEHPEHRVRRHLAEHFATRESLAWQPWVAVRKKLFDGRGGPVVLRYCFRNAARRVPAVALVAEDLHQARLKVNGSPVETAGCQWHWDRGFGKVDITDRVIEGENFVELALDYDFLAEVEPAYVVGDFGVRLRSPWEGELCAEPRKLDSGSWAPQGYPFYPGSMVYRQVVAHRRRKGLRTFLRLRNPSGTLFLVRVNGQEAGRILWRPYVVELTEHLASGENELEVEVVASQHNAHGPLHVREGDSFRWFGPNAFEDDRVLRRGFSLFDYGLLDGAELVHLKT